PFSSVDNIAQPAYRHSENLFDDFRREVLLPHTLSALGPFSSVADVNGDGLEDFYIGGAMGRAGSLYLQDSDGSFQIKYLAAFNRDAGFEDMGSHFFDCDQDGDLDLYVVSGGNEQALGGGKYQDRLYLNDGSGSYSHSDGLTEMDFSGSVAVSSDWDGDGDLDLFIGGRQLPGKYPHPVSSVLLRNDGDRFTNVTSTVAPSLEQLGMVTSALWMDHDADGDEDLFVAGEWMPLTLLENRAGQFELTTVSGFANTTGWWFSLASADLDGDGDEDLIAGNVGLNYKYKASDLEPFEVYSSDLDENGKNDIVLAFHEEDNVYPLRGKSCSTEQMPSLKQRYTTYKDFAAADIFEVYGQNKLEEALHLKATLFASTTIENLGDGNFRLQPLPDYAQLSSINGIVTHDVDGDGLLDLIVAGNMYGSEVETVRNDASVGMYLHNQGGMNFKAIAYPESGLYLPGDIKSLRKIQTKEGTLLMAGENQAYLSWVKVHEEGGAAGYSTGIK
ncbi:MAG: VCBS repeat-containing protein, partial [Bacteroidota bacterium]